MAGTRNSRAPMLAALYLLRMKDALILVRTSSGSEGRIYIDLNLYYGDSELFDSNDYFLSFSALKKASWESGTFFLITCGCGTPGCAGIYNPIKVEHNGDEVVWFIQEPIKKDVKFSASQLQDQVLGAEKRLKELGFLNFEEQQFSY